MESRDEDIPPNRLDGNATLDDFAFRNGREQK